jgi:hypothetical protein
MVFGTTVGAAGEASASSLIVENLTTHAP